MSGGPQVFLGATTFCLIALSCGRYVGAGLLGVPVGGGPPASRPRCELRSARRLEARPGPAVLAAASNRAALGMLQLGPAVLAAASNRAALGMLRPGPAAAHVHRSQAPRSCDDGLLNNVARNSLACLSYVEVASLELQRFERGSNTDRWKLCATFVLADVVASSHRQRDPAQQ